MPQLDVVTFVNQYVWLIGSITLSIILLVSLMLLNIKKLIEIRTNTSDENISFLIPKEFNGLKEFIHYKNG